GEVQASRDDLGGLAGTPERTRVEAFGLHRGEALRQPKGLVPAGLVERRIGVTLEAQLAIPVGFAVPGEEERGHAARLVGPWSLDSRGRAASSPHRPAESDARRRESWPKKVRGSRRAGAVRRPGWGRCSTSSPIS